MRRQRSLIFFTFIIVTAATFVGGQSTTNAAESRGYVLTAAKWGQAQDIAVRAAGGTVEFSHDKAGIGVVTSSTPDFLSRALASRAFQTAAEDMMVQWQGPTQNLEFEESAVDPSNDALFPIQWSMPAMNVPAAWGAGYTGDGVRVAVLDGGIYSAHTDLDDNLDVAASASFVPGQAWNTDTGTFWHGTHVAGIIAAEDNARGTVGVAPDATIIGVKVLHNGSGSFGWIIGGLLYAADGANADIINMSLGALFPRGDGNTGAGALVAALNKAVNYANGRGVLVVSAAGNSAVDLDHSYSYIAVPAQSGSGIAIAATGPIGWALAAPLAGPRDPSSFTNYGNSAIHVAAPGGDFALPGEDLCTVAGVTNRCWVFDMVISTSRGGASLPATGGYSWAAGTSMAAPAVAGVAALIKERCPNAGPAALENLLADSADDEGKPGNDPFYGKGFANALRAVTEGTCPVE